MKISLLIAVILILSSPRLTTLEYIYSDAGMVDGCDMDHPVLKWCCCEEGHKELSSWYDYHDNLSLLSTVTYESISYYKVNKPILYKNCNLSSFYMPLKTIRLLI